MPSCMLGERLSEVAVCAISSSAVRAGTERSLERSREQVALFTRERLTEAVRWWDKLNDKRFRRRLPLPSFPVSSCTLTNLFSKAFKRTWTTKAETKMAEPSIMSKNRRTCWKVLRVDRLMVFNPLSSNQRVFQQLMEPLTLMSLHLQPRKWHL